MLSRILRLLLRDGLSTQAQFCDDGAVTLDVTILQVFEERATLTYQHSQSSLCTIIFTVSFEVFRQMGNTV